MKKADDKGKLQNNKIIMTVIFAVSVVVLCTIFYFVEPFIRIEKSASNDIFPVMIKAKPVNDLEVHFIDVGQGDCILIKTPDSKFILIDAGEYKYSDNSLVDYLNNCSVKTIDYLIATHSDSDHIGGLEKIFDNFKVKFVFRPYIRSQNLNSSQFSDKFNPVTSTYCSTDIYARFLKSVYSEHSDWAYFNKDTDIIFDYGDSKLKLDFLSPINNVSEIFYVRENNYSPMIKLDYSGKSFLFTGDAEELVENEIIEYYSTEELDIDVLKVAHHGASTSTSMSFLQVITPDYAVISCGKNNLYKHPKQTVINSLVLSTALVMRTDILGNIVFKVSKDGILSNVHDKPYTDDYLNGY